MTLLEEIQAEAIDSGSDIGAILRKCKLLAARLGSKPLEDWLLWESNGYPSNVEVPDYRIWPLDLKGNFSGPFGTGLKNAPIPYITLPEGSREFLEKYKCTQSVAAIEAILRGKTMETLYVPTGDLPVVLGTKVYKNMNCLQAWGEFGTTHLIELLNTVRNRVLDFSLALWKEVPSAGELAGSSNRIGPEKVTQIFNTTIYGGVASVIGAAYDSTLLLTISANNFSSLEKALLQSGIQKNDVNELKAAVDSEDIPKEKGKFGEKVVSWIEKMKKKAIDGSWNISLGAAGNLLAEAISKYYGF